MSMLTFVLLYVIGIPVSTLLHESRHALAVVLVSNGRVHVYVGAKNLPENFRIGRIHFHIKWGFFGYCDLPKGSKLTRYQMLIFIASEPIMYCSCRYYSAI